MSEEFEGEKFIKGREGGSYYSGFYVDWLEEKIVAYEVKFRAIMQALKIADERNIDSEVGFYIDMAFMAAQDALGQFEKS